MERRPSCEWNGASPQLNVSRNQESGLKTQWCSRRKVRRKDAAAAASPPRTLLLLCSREDGLALRSSRITLTALTHHRS